MYIGILLRTVGSCLFSVSGNMRQVQQGSWTNKLIKFVLSDMYFLSYSKKGKNIGHVEREDGEVGAANKTSSPVQLRYIGLSDLVQYFAGRRGGLGGGLIKKKENQFLLLRIATKKIKVETTVLLSYSTTY